MKKFRKLSNKASKAGRNYSRECFRQSLPIKTLVLWRLYALAFLLLAGLSVPATAQLYRAINPSTERWYQLIHTGSDKALDVPGSSKAIGEAFCLWGFHGGENQQFCFESTGDGCYRIKNRVNHLYLGPGR